MDFQKNIIGSIILSYPNFQDFLSLIFWVLKFKVFELQKKIFDKIKKKKSKYLETKDLKKKLKLFFLIIFSRYFFRFFKIDFFGFENSRLRNVAKKKIPKKII